MQVGTVYLVESKTSGKLYIGQTWKPIEVRWKEHVSTTKKLLLHNAIRKYGPEDFSISIIETDINVQSDLDNAEIFWIEWYNSIVPFGYNLTFGGRGGKLSELTKAKISASHKGIRPSEETKQKLRDANLGKKASLETRILLSKMRIGHAVSEETKQKIRESKLGKPRSPETIEKMRAAGIGKKHSLEHKQKISNSLKGHAPWSKGKPCKRKNSK
ncbi:MAG: GIY-YIG nuclease family protein [Patescibacteria group bacterium]|nr:GIY-YIG nuclease family protein [Patescibacteria group bacterium]